MIAGLILSLMIPVPQGATSACTSPVPAERIAGTWRHDFVGAEWTFELTQVNGGWSGRYRSPKTGAWHPLAAMGVSGGCATLTMPSQPKVIYRVAAGADGTTLTGEVEIEGLMTRPATMRRAS